MLSLSVTVTNSVYNQQLLNPFPQLRHLP
jgi:hypothetical protein